MSWTTTTPAVMRVVPDCARGVVVLTIAVETEDGTRAEARMSPESARGFILDVQKAIRTVDEWAGDSGITS